MAGILKAVGSFAKGYADEKRRQSEDARVKELHELQVAKLRDEKAMNEEFKALDAGSKPTEAHVLIGADGSRTVFADEKQAKTAAASMPGAQLEKKHMVGGKTFDTPEAAADAADALNAPAARLRQRSEIALKYNRPDIADSYVKNYENVLNANRTDLQQRFLEARQMGDHGSVLDLVNQRLKKNGAQATLVPGENGTLNYQVVKDGQVVMATPFKNADEWWDKMSEQVANSPKDMLETWRVKQQLGLQKAGLDIQAKGVEIQGRVADAGIAKTNKEVSQMDAELGLKTRQVKAAETSASASATSAAATAKNANTAAEELTRPKVYTGVDGKNQVSVFQAAPVKDPKTGAYGLNVSQPQVVPGVLPTGMAKPDSLGLMPQQAPLVIDWSKLPPKK